MSALEQAARAAGEGRGREALGARRVLLVDTLSGANDFGVALAESLAARVPTTVLTVTDTRLAGGPGLRVLAAIPEYGGARSRVRKGLALARYLLVLARELWAHRNDAVHVQFLRSPFAEAAIYALARPWLRTVVHTAHNALPHEPRWWHRPFHRAWYRLFDRIHVLGHATARDIAALGVPPARIAVIPHGNYVPFRRRCPPRARETTRRRMDIPEDAVVFLQYGLVRAYKGTDRLVDAFCRVADERAFLVIAGGGAAEAFVDARARLRRAGKEDRSRCLHAFLADQDLSDLIEASDVLVFPYRRISQSGALLLGMTYGKPAIASDLPGFREYAEDGREALLVDTADGPTFAGAIARLCSDPSLRSSLGEASRRRAQGDYGWDRIADALVALYTDGSK